MLFFDLDYYSSECTAVNGLKEKGLIGVDFHGYLALRAYRSILEPDCWW